MFVAPLLLITLMAFDVPLVYMLSQSVFSPNPTLSHYKELVRHPAYLQILGNTFRIGVITTVVCAVVGFPVAYWISTLSRRGRIVALGLVVLSFWISILVRTYAWIVILGNNGLVNRALLQLGLVGSPIQLIYNSTGVVVGTVNVLLPFMLFPLYARMASFDQRLLRAAASLGASGRQAFLRVYLPLTMPALATGAVLVFILTLGFYVTPMILGGGNVQMIATSLDTYINRYPDWGLASALSTILLVTVLVCYAGYSRLGRARG